MRYDSKVELLSGMHAQFPALQEKQNRSNIPNENKTKKQLPLGIGVVSCLGAFLSLWREVLVTSLLAWKKQMKGGRVDLTDSVMDTAHRGR